MKDNNDYYDNNDEGKSEDQSLKKDLPESNTNKLTFDNLLDINKKYYRQLTKIIDNNIITKKPIILSKNDLKVLNNLLLENFDYMLQILPKTIYKVELDNLYTISNSILNALSQFDQNEIIIYQKLQKLKFMELKFHSLRINGSKDDFSKADVLLEEIENLQKDPLVLPSISMINISTILLYRGLTRFYLEDFDGAQKYAMNALDLMERKSFSDNDKNISEGRQNKGDNINNEEENKHIKKISQILEFLVELYDLKKDYKSAYSCYEKAYYLNVGRFGVNHPSAQLYKRKKEQYENYLSRKEANNYGNANYYDYGNQNYGNPNENNYNNDFMNRKLIQGNISNAKGTADTYSFKVPVTKIVEPMIISIYALAEDPEQDRFSSELFLKNIYFDKKKLFDLLGIKDNSMQMNYILYTDDAINDILENIQVDENRNILIDDPILLNALINC